MYNRLLESSLQKWQSKYRIIAVVGPRQSGKSTLCRKAFPDYHVINLENPQTRALVQADPIGEILGRGPRILIDEVQRWPDLFSYLQVWTDEAKNDLRIVITGSNHFLLMEKITQSLAGRVIIAELLPLSQVELAQVDDQSVSAHSLEDRMFIGGYPRLYHEHLDPSEWFEQYIQAYVERDVRELTQVRDLDLFQKFLGLCAGRVGALLNEASLANDCGITHPTVKAWLSVLKASFVAFTLKPHHRNFSKRLIKQAKLYFYDTGLLCHLLGLQNAQQLSNHPLRGAIFENWVITEMIKERANAGKRHHLYFWRDQTGHEVDVLDDQGTILEPTEIKSSRTVFPEHFEGLAFFRKIQAKSLPKDIACPVGRLIYAGDTHQSFKDISVVPWGDVGK